LLFLNQRVLIKKHIGKKLTNVNFYVKSIIKKKLFKNYVYPDPQIMEVILIYIKINVFAKYVYKRKKIIMRKEEILDL